MAKYEYNRYKIIIDPESKKTQGFLCGDVVRRQYLDTPKLIYSLMIVLEVGVDLINDKESHYFIGALLEGDEPKKGDLGVFWQALQGDSSCFGRWCVIRNL